MFRMVTRRIKKVIAWIVAIGVLGLLGLGAIALVSMV